MRQELIAAGQGKDFLSRRSGNSRREGATKNATTLGEKSSWGGMQFSGFALIVAAHLGHVDVVLELIAAGAPLDHVNNLGWTALIEAVILGDGGPRHTRIVAALIKAGANRAIADRQGATPLAHARAKAMAP